VSELRPADRLGGDAPSAWASLVGAVAHVVLESTVGGDDPLRDEMVVDGDDGHHLQRVRRLEAGEVVTIADGDGRWRPYRVRDAAKGRLALEATGIAAREPSLTPGLTVACALTKGSKPEAVVTRLTELGVDRVLFVVTRHSVARWKGGAPVALTRLRRVAREAAMQCRRARVPTLDGPTDGPDGLAVLTVHPGLVVADPAGGPVAALTEPGPQGWLLAVGPEGGFAPDELEAFGTAPRLGVGPFVLRADTAAVAVAAALTTRRKAEDCHAA
jgi:16S rRNA (uracil1498-N3)-methyltransferase